MYKSDFYLGLNKQISFGVILHTALPVGKALSLCKLKTPKPVLWQTVKTQMKCILSGSALFAKIKTTLKG